ncbi:FecR domain-containing protein [Henriciella sp.]|uniref:FecR family protein n=1 Tax=Henriciella sp. TaxID=1968823 RepID=UPI002610D793|nr:FecR domain-containing protein [Henriciella sp.]
MTAHRDRYSERLKAAADWYAELQEPGLSHETWEAFQAWESDPANAAAFGEIERSLVAMDRSGFGRRAREDREVSRKDRVPGWVGWLGGIAALVLIGLVVVGVWPAAQPVAPDIYVTDIGEVRQVVLADGSTVTLNTASRVEVRLGEDAREIELAWGEALFDVAGEARPFVVMAGASRTEALGTRFNVQAGGDEVAITLVEGSVRVGASDGAGQGSVLEPGDQLVMQADGGVEVSEVDLESVGRWTSGLVQFDNTTLAEAVAEMNRYSSVTIRIGDQALAAERISGSFPAGQQRDFAESLELFLPVTADMSGRTITLRRQERD